jgi:endonuclease/exonuclease/phosphatase family metal-dependent hydrolase
MAAYKILMSNIGYARGINGCLSQHIRYAGRYLYCSRKTQHDSLCALKKIIDKEKPDLGCLIEIDKGSYHLAYVNQLHAVIDDHYRYYDIQNKYGNESGLRYMPGSEGKCNAFFSNQELAFERIYFTHGTKRLIYKVNISSSITLFFTHFSLKRRVREKQFKELGELVKNTVGEVIIMGDFNIFKGFNELTPLLRETGLKLLSKEHEHTFTFHRNKLALDLCLCSENISDKAELKIIDQPFSDHAALLLRLDI